jgi:hypothetical protein
MAAICFTVGEVDIHPDYTMGVEIYIIVMIHVVFSLVPDGGAEVIYGDAKAAAYVYQLVKGYRSGVLQTAGQGIV